MKFVPASVTRVAAKTAFKAGQHSPKLLLAAGVVGIGAGVVMACRATLKVDEILDEARHDIADSEKEFKKNPSTHDESTHDATVKYLRTRAGVEIVKCYAPSAAVLTLSVAAVCGSHVILSRRNVALAAAYTSVVETFNQYRERVIENIGEDRERDIYMDVEKRQAIIRNEDGSTKMVSEKGFGPGAGDMYSRVFEEATSNSWNPRVSDNLSFLRQQQDWANDRLYVRGHLFLNEVFDMLGMERTPAGARAGWLRNGEGDNFVTFGIDDHNQPTSAIHNDTAAFFLDFNVDGDIHEHI